MKKFKDLPKQFRKQLKEEEVEFIAYSRKYAKKRKRNLMMAAVAHLIFGTVFLVIIAWPFFMGKPFVYNNGVNTPYISLAYENLTPFSGPFIVPTIVYVLALLLFIKAFLTRFKKGHYIVGTRNKLIIYKKKILESKAWHEFTRFITVEDMGNYGNLTLIVSLTNVSYLATASFESKKDVDEKIELSEIPNFREVEKKCRILIRNSKTKV